MSCPRFSIVTVCYNHARYLESCIQSVLAQNYPNLEYIIIDGGSTDGSVEIIRKYAARLAYWVSEPDKGQTDALLKGFRRATGELEGWLNSDDMLSPGALHEVANFFEHHPAAQVVTGDVELMRADGSMWRVQRQLPFMRFLWLNDHNYIGQSSTFWRRELYERVGGLDASFNLAMDGDLFGRFADVTRLYKVSHIWSRFRVYDQQKTARLLEEGAEENQRIRRRYYPSETAFGFQARRLVARPLRLLLKLAMGCYRA
jgi:glycosyltransferase involved in cell wall biosynthesis